MISCDVISQKAGVLFCVKMYEKSTGVSGGAGCRDKNVDKTELLLHLIKYNEKIICKEKNKKKY